LDTSGGGDAASLLGKLPAVDTLALLAPTPGMLVPGTPTFKCAAEHRRSRVLPPILLLELTPSATLSHLLSAPLLPLLVLLVQLTAPGQQAESPLWAHVGRSRDVVRPRT